MSHQITDYHVLFYGSPDGYQNNRAQIALYGNDGQTKAYVRFHDEGHSFPNDSVVAGRIVMHLPSSQFGNVIDVLRNEDGIYIYFVAGRAFLGTAKEPIGEGED
jgi:hypothetical protein